MFVEFFWSKHSYIVQFEAYANVVRYPHAPGLYLVMRSDETSLPSAIISPSIGRYLEQILTAMSACELNIIRITNAPEQYCNSVY